MEHKKIIAVLPARYQSSRFPGKPLAGILGKPMIRWVYERVCRIPEIAETFVATDDRRICAAVEAFGGKAVLTEACNCGTERVYKACRGTDADIILNIQGDEPLIREEMIRNLLCAFRDEQVGMATLKKRIDTKDVLYDPNVAKVITDIHGDAVCFSRSVIPYDRDGRGDVIYYKHIGVYGYTRDFLEKFVELVY